MHLYIFVLEYCNKNEVNKFTKIVVKNNELVNMMELFILIYQQIIIIIALI